VKRRGFLATLGLASAAAVLGVLPEPGLQPGDVISTPSGQPIIGMLEIRGDLYVLTKDRTYILDGRRLKELEPL
jgi:hypothetical protein